MLRIASWIFLTALVTAPTAALASVTPVAGGFEVEYDIDLQVGTSNGSDIQDVLIFEWNGSGDFHLDTGFTVAARGRTALRHSIAFEPDAAIVMGWGAGVAGVGDEKDHLFTLVNYAFAAENTGRKWSEAFPGVPPVPRTGHNAMVGLLQAAAGGDQVALDSITAFVEREAGPAAFDPDGAFRVMEWTTGQPIDRLMVAITTLSGWGLGLLALALGLLAARFARG